MQEYSDSYIYKLNWISHETLKDLIFSEQYKKDGLKKSVLKWLAGTLDSENTLLLSWPNSKEEMEIHEHAYKTSMLKSRKYIICFEQFSDWLNETAHYYSLDDTSNIEELQKAHINSFFALKIFTKEKEFHAKQILMVCNRKNPAIKGHMYISYDWLFSDIAKWILQLHTSELYKLKKERYNDAKKRYEDSKIASSLRLLGETSRKLLELYDQYHAEPPLYLLYDCLNTHIALFNAKQKKEEDIIELLQNCEKHWFEGFEGIERIDKNFVKYVLARGYFALGIDRNECWIKGKKILNQK